MELRRQMGNDSEILARCYLEQQGYQFLHANFTCKWGEIDLIMQKAQELVFVEVRSRSSKQYGEPSETVNRKKQEKIRKTIRSNIFWNLSKRFTVSNIKTEPSAV